MYGVIIYGTSPYGCSGGSSEYVLIWPIGGVLTVQTEFTAEISIIGG